MATPCGFRLPVLLLALTAGCGSDVVRPGAGDAALELSPQEVVVTSLGSVVTVTARVGDRVVENVAWRLIHEERWLQELAVLRESALANGLLVGDAPGVALLEASVSDARPDTLWIEVAPSRPIVLAAAYRVGSPDTLVVRGYRLTALAGASATVENVAASWTADDSATGRVVVPASVGAGCVGTSGLAYAIAGADIAASAGVRRPRPAELDLEVGEVRSIPAGASGCLQLAPHTGAAYTVAFLDPYVVESGRSAPTEYQPVGFFDVSITDRSRAAMTAVQPVPAAPAGVAVPGSDVVRRGPVSAAQSALDDPLAFPNHPGPWVEGETFDLATGDGWASFRARVMAVLEGYFAVVAPEADTAFYRVHLASKFAFAAAGVARVGVPYLQRVLSSRRMVTNPQANQLLLVVVPASGWEAEGRAYLLPTPYVGLKFGDQSEREFVLRTLAHEVAHVWQMGYVWDRDAAGQAGGTPQIWGVEGGAELAQYEILRELLGLGFSENWDWVAGGQQDALAAWFADAVLSGTGWIGAGYGSGAGFQRDFISRLMAAGLSYDDAAREVYHGSLNGWYGCRTAWACGDLGLVSRMRVYLGAGWSAEDALLRYALGNAADDRTPNPELQVPTFLAAYRYPGREGLAAWTLTTPLVAGSGGTVAPVIRPLVGSVQYFYIDDAGLGGSYALTASRPVRWEVARYR